MLSFLINILIVRSETQFLQTILGVVKAYFVQKLIKCFFYFEVRVWTTVAWLNLVTK